MLNGFAAAGVGHRTAVARAQFRSTDAYEPPASVKATSLSAHSPWHSPQPSGQVSRTKSRTSADVAVHKPRLTASAQLAGASATATAAKARSRS